MEHSEEIRRVVERWTRAIAEGDIDCLARLSEHPGALIVGTDPAEWWRGTATREVWGRQIEELRGVFSVQADEIDAWEEGTVGWAAVKETISVDGSSREARATYVLRLEHGEWKVVQAHWSLPQEKIETFGRPLTMTIDELATIVQRDQPNLSEMLNPEGTVTIVFTDIVDSTVLLRRLGDHTWLEILQRHNAVIEETTASAADKERARAPSCSALNMEPVALELLREAMVGWQPPASEDREAVRELEMESARLRDETNKLAVETELPLEAVKARTKALTTRLDAVQEELSALAPVEFAHSPTAFDLLMSGDADGIETTMETKRAYMRRFVGQIEVPAKMGAKEANAA